jgi:hypothetical protein
VLFKISKHEIRHPKQTRMTQIGSGVSGLGV